MKNAWSTEVSRLLLLFASVVIFGFISNFWLLSVSLHFVLYIAWTMFQLKSFERWIRNGARSVHAPDTNGIWALIVQHIYRTQKKNKERKQKLSNLAKRYQAIMKALPDATIVLNEKLEIEWANHASESLLGIDLERDVGHRVDNVVRDLSIQELLANNDMSAYVQLASPIDSQKTLILNKVKFGDSQTILTARDITQRILLLKMRKAFVANASHELRTPLTVISGYLEMLDSDEDLPPTINRLINNAHQQAKRMDQILDDLLVLSKLEEKGFEKNRGEPLNVTQMLKCLVADFEKIGLKKSQIIEVNLDENLKVKVVENELYSLSQNLISNAIKYSGVGSTIRVCWNLAPDGSACLKVIDQGEGIAPEHLSRLTERFFRINVNRAQKVGGTGLGLSIVKHILENYGGHLGIESELGEGSSFNACFPKYRVVV